MFFKKLELAAVMAFICCVISVLLVIYFGGCTWFFQDNAFVCMPKYTWWDPVGFTVFYTLFFLSVIVNMLPEPSYSWKLFMNDFFLRGNTRGLAWHSIVIGLFAMLHIFFSGEKITQPGIFVVLVILLAMMLLFAVFLWQSGVIYRDEKYEAILRDLKEIDRKWIQGRE